MSDLRKIVSEMSRESPAETSDSMHKNVRKTLMICRLRLVRSPGLQISIIVKQVSTRPNLAKTQLKSFKPLLDSRPPFSSIPSKSKIKECQVFLPSTTKIRMSTRFDSCSMESRLLRSHCNSTIGDNHHWKSQLYGKSYGNRIAHK